MTEINIGTAQKNGELSELAGFMTREATYIVGSSLLYENKLG